MATFIKYDQSILANFHRNNPFVLDRNVLDLCSIVYLQQEVEHAQTSRELQGGSWGLWEQSSGEQPPRGAGWQSAYMTMETMKGSGELCT